MIETISSNRMITLVSINDKDVYDINDQDNLQFTIIDFVMTLDSNYYISNARSE